MRALWDRAGHGVCACLLSLALASGCSPGDDVRGARDPAPATIVVDGETIDVGILVEAVAGLCQARQEAVTDTRTAKATYDRRSKQGVATVARVLQRSSAILASSVAEAVQRVEAAGASIADDLARLTELVREGMARLGITTAPCER